MPISIENNQITILNPATLNEVGKVNISSEEDVNKCIDVAQNYKEWSSLSLNKRCSIINKFRKVILKNSDLIRKTIKDEHTMKE